MQITELYRQIYKVIANDQELLNLMDMNAKIEAEKNNDSFITDEQATLLAKAKHFKKRSKPQDILKTLPLISFYTPGGEQDSSNYLIYDPIFNFDIYTANDVEQAHRISDRLFKLLTDKHNCFDNVGTFKTHLLEMYESNAKLDDVYAWTSVILFSFELEY